MKILIGIAILLFVLIVGAIFYLATGLNKWFYHDILEWHQPTEIHVPYMGITFESRCKHCGKKIMRDSQGNWY